MNPDGDSPRAASFALPAAADRDLPRPPPRMPVDERPTRFDGAKPSNDDQKVGLLNIFGYYRPSALVVQ